MRTFGWVPAILIATSACSSGGPSDGPAPPVSWTPGRYTLEATIDTSDGDREELTGDLRIRPDGTMTLLSSFGSCRVPTPDELRRDEERRQRTFTCGDATYVIRPTANRVRGQVRARITESYQQSVQCRAGQSPPCYRTSSRRVTRTANLAVFVID